LFRNYIKKQTERNMNKLAQLLGLKAKFRIKEVMVGVKIRYQIQKTTFGFLWSTVINPLIVNPASPYEYKMKSDAEKKILKLQSAS